MSSGQALVTVVIPTFNRPQLLNEALRSIISQQWSDIEVLVIDDASDQRANNLVQQLAAEAPPGRMLRYLARSELRPDLRGPQVCRNIGIAEASGDFILFLDDDDLLAPICIEHRMAILTANPALDFCVGQCRQFQDFPKDHDPLWQDWHEGQDDLLQFLANQVPWQTSGPLWRRRAVVRFGGWNESLEAGHDYEVHVRALARGARYVRSRTTDYYWRAPRPDSYSGLERFKQLHAEGALIDAFVASIAALDSARCWSPDRLDAARYEAIRLALTCRLFGGDAATARPAFAAARASGCEKGYELMEAAMCNRLWLRVGGRIPALAWASRRGLMKC